MRKLALCGVVAGVAVSALSVISDARAQDNNQWSQQFGTRSALMGGAVVGGVRDTSATFYNPGALGFITNPSLSVSANAYQLERLTLENGAGTGSDLDSSQVNVVPLLISGVYIPEKNSKHVFAYSILTKENTEFKFSERATTTADVLQNQFAPGLEDYIGQLNVGGTTKETWGNISYSYRLLDNLSLGIGNYIAYRAEDFNYSSLQRAVNKDNPNALSIGTVDETRVYDYDNARLLWKAGAAAEYGSVKLGLTATSPSVNIYGDGTVAGDFTVTGIDLGGSGVPQSFVADDRQEGLDADITSPPSVAWGIEWAVDPRNRAAATIEWFGGVGGYTVIQPEEKDFVLPIGAEPSLTSDNLLRVRDAADAIVNVAAGFEHDFSDRYSGILGFYTDFETRQPIDNVRGVSAWDIYNLSIGGVRRGEHSDFSLGLVYSFGGTSQYAQVTNFSNPNEVTLVLPDLGDADVEYNAYKVIAGYTYYLD